MLEIGCAWSKGSGERLQGHRGPLVINFLLTCQRGLNCLHICTCSASPKHTILLQCKD